MPRRARIPDGQARVTRSFFELGGQLDDGVQSISAIEFSGGQM